MRGNRRLTSKLRATDLKWPQGRGGGGRGGVVYESASAIRAILSHSSDSLCTHL